MLEVKKKTKKKKGRKIIIKQAPESKVGKKSNTIENLKTKIKNQKSIKRQKRKSVEYQKPTKIMWMGKRIHENYFHIYTHKKRKTRGDGMREREERQFFSFRGGGGVGGGSSSSHSYAHVEK